MVRLRKKLQSERGASILLALLMLLVCMMVAASVLAAAASNAGKARSNRVEQQKYLTVSSAIQLVADEFEKATYTGKYTLYEWTVVTEEKDETGKVISTSSEDFFYIEQNQGVFKCGDLGEESGTSSTAVIPLLKELDAIFAEQFNGSGYGNIDGLGMLASTDTHTLTVTLPAGLTGYPYDTGAGPDAYKISDTVTVKVRLDHATHHIILTASLEDGSDPMSAELVAKVQKKDEDGNPVLTDGNPLVTVPPPAGATAAESKVDDAPKTYGTTDTMTWQLHWIRKGAA